MGIFEVDIRGEIDGSLEEVRGAGGGGRDRVGEEVIELGLPEPVESVGPDRESLLAIAAGAVGGDRSDTCVDDRAFRMGSSWERIESA